MKRALLKVFLFLFIGAGMVAQNKQLEIKKEPRAFEKDNLIFDQPQQVKQLAPLNYSYKAASSSTGVSKVPFGSSWNAYTLLVSESNCLTANEDLDMIMFTHRQCSSYPGNAGGSGYIQVTTTTDFANTVDSSLVIVSDDQHLLRYPSGVIYNPTGNTNPDEAYAIVAGPKHQGSGWDGNYFGSAKLDSTYIDEQFYTVGDSGVNRQQFARLGFSITDLGNAYVCGIDYNVDYTGGSDFDYVGSVLNSAVLDTSTHAFTWTDTVFAPNLNVDVDGFPDLFHYGSTAWSQDGMTGYYVVLGARDTSAVSHSVPYVWKTVDAGVTWQEMAFFDFSQLSEFQQSVPPTRQGNVSPFFTSGNGYDLIVDGYDQLHVVCQIAGGATEDMDSLGYYLLGYQLYYDVYTTDSGWNAFFIDTLRSEKVSTDDSGYDVGWDARLQVSKTTDGTKLFYAWMDTDPMWADLNLVPDLFVKGHDLATGNLTYTKNLTSGTEYDGLNFWMYLSDISFTEDTVYKIPMTTSDIPGTDLEAVFHYFVTGVQFTDSEFLPDSVVNSIYDKSADFGRITQIFPNPVNNMLSVAISLTGNTEATIELYDALGTLVSQNVENLSNGNNVITVNTSDLESGIYFVSVASEENKLVRRFVKE